MAILLQNLQLIQDRNILPPMDYCIVGNQLKPVENEDFNHYEKVVDGVLSQHLVTPFTVSALNYSVANITSLTLTSYPKLSCNNDGIPNPLIRIYALVTYPSASPTATPSRSASSTVTPSRTSTPTITVTPTPTVSATGICNDARVYFYGSTVFVSGDVNYYVRHGVNITHPDRKSVV